MLEKKSIVFHLLVPACLTQKRNLHIEQLMLYHSHPLSCPDGMDRV